MRKRFNAIMVAVAAVLLATTACQKEQSYELKSSKGISVSIQGSIDDFTPDSGPKATVEPVVRVKWAENDVVYAYDATQKLGELKVHLKNDDTRYAYLTSDGTITEPAGSTITLVYAGGCEPEFNEGKLTFDISDQDAAQTAFVLYGTLEYDGTGIIEDVYVPFHFATSVMMVNCAGLGGKDISWAAVYGVNNTCQLTLSATGEPEVAGINEGLVTRSGAEAFVASNDGRAAFSIAVVASPQSSARKIRVYRSNCKLYESAFTSGQIKPALSINTICALQERVQEYVEINGLLWAKENLAITSSGYKDFNGTGHLNGDYFQWAAYAGYAGAQTDYDKGLLVYKSFNSTCCGDAVSAFEFKDNGSGSDMHFWPEAPYIVDPDADPTKYDDKYSLDGTKALKMEDDAANIILGGNWRIPSSTEFNAMKKATYWKYDSEDNGWYVYTPKTDADKGKVNEQGAGIYDKQEALLFFPIAGHGAGGKLKYTGEIGCYWENDLWENGQSAGALFAAIQVSGLSIIDTQDRVFGNSIRPVCTVTE